MMSDREKRWIMERYSARLAEYGPIPIALGWNKPKQMLRFKILLEYWDVKSWTCAPRLLDFGCGFGDLYHYLQRQALNVSYCGVDINPDLIAVAKKRYPEAEFLTADLFRGDLSRQFDIVLSSGVHNLKLQDSLGFIKESFDVFDGISNAGFAVNFLSNRVNHENAENYYAAPEDILNLAFEYTERVSLRHDYMPFEFTVFVDKRVRIIEDVNVFEPFSEWLDK